MALDYGFEPLENEIIALFYSDTPNFEVVEELIAKGADVNAVGSDDESNVLSCILEGCTSMRSIPECELCSKDEYCSFCKHLAEANSKCTEFVIKTIRFFIAHGFDVHKQNDRFGAQCLYVLTLSTFDRHMLALIKTLLDAGATNRTISEHSDHTPMGFIGTESSYQLICLNNYHLANIYEAAYAVYLAAEEGRPYDGIDSYELAIGKQITRVLAEQSERGEVFYDLALPGFERKNCFNETLYFVYDGGCLVTTQYGDFWTDTVLPDKQLIDVSERFSGAVGNTIEKITFEHSEVIKKNTRYSSPITTVQMSSGMNVVFGVNFGEGEKENLAAYYDLSVK